MSAIAWVHVVNYSIQPGSFIAVLCAGFLFGLSYFPIVAILSAIGFLQLDKSHEESAQLYHRDRTVFLKVSLPLARPFILSSAILVFLFVVLDYGVPDFFGVKTYSVELFTKFALHNISGAVIATYPLLFITISLVIVESLLVRGKSYIPEPSSWKQNFKKQSRIAPFFLGVIVLISGGLPCISLLQMAGKLSNYVPALKASLPSISNSILFASLSAAAITLFGFIWAHFVDSVKRGRVFLNGLSNINLAIPGGLIAISLIIMWNHSFSQWIYGTIIIIILCNFARFSPIAYKAILAPLISMDQNIKDLTNITTANYVLMTKKVFFPQARQGLLFGFMLAFLFSFRELEAPLLILPPGKETLPIRIFSLIHYGAYENIAVLSLLLCIVGFAFSLIILTLVRRTSQ